MFTYVKNVVISFFFSPTLLCPTPTDTDRVALSVIFNNGGFETTANYKLLLMLTSEIAVYLCENSFGRGSSWFIFYTLNIFVCVHLNIYSSLYVCVVVHDVCSWFITSRISTAQQSEAKRRAAQRSTSLRCQQVGHLSPGSGIDENWQLNAHIKQSSACSSCQQST